MLLQQMLTPFVWKLGIFSFKYNFLCFCGNILITFIGLLFDVPSDMYIRVYWTNPLENIVNGKNVQKNATLSNISYTNEFPKNQLYFTNEFPTSPVDK